MGQHQVCKCFHSPTAGKDSKRGVEVGSGRTLNGNDGEQADREFGDEGGFLSTPWGLPPMLLAAATLAKRGELARLSPYCSLLAQPGGWACAKTVSQGNVFSVFTVVFCGNLETYLIVQEILSTISL